MSPPSASPAAPVASTLPGQPEVPADLPGRLAAALAAKGPGYTPRTHHLLPEGGPRYANRLVLETSPYLLQHAHNPVNWYPWGEEAFADARRLGRPVFLSIGYSTCHWCHVMERESFEDEEIAAFLNQHYIPVKVDREERPDIDAIYMSAVQAFTGSGGWPLSAWLTADRLPFFVGTYFPPRDGARGARFGFLTVLQQIARTFIEDQERVQQATGPLIEAVKEQMEGLAAQRADAGVTWQATAAPIELAVETYARIFDPVHGGLRRAPKFPSNLPVRLLLRHHRRARPEAGESALHMATVTLAKMAGGGIYDQIGGGFHRYATDQRWLVPHFEKMLYDNALLAVAYAEAWQVTRRDDFARVLRETLDYILREMTSPEGGFYSATDADSEGEEGKFFVWSKAEVEAVLGPEAERFCRYYDITAEGNFEGHNIPNAPRPDEAEHAALAGARAKLYEVRARRVPPLRDDKILAAWNGLMISGLAVGGRVLGEPRYVEAAARAADFLLGRLRQGGRLMRAYKDGRPSAQGFLEDQAFVIQGLLDLVEAGGQGGEPAGADPRWLREALALADAQEVHFADRARGGWFMTADDAEVLIAREKPAYDGAEPSGTSVALLNALRLHAFTSDDRWRQVAEACLRFLGPQLAQQPLGLSEGLLALDHATDQPREVVLVLPAGAPADAGASLREVLRTTFLPNRALAVTREGPAQAALAALAPFVADKTASDGLPTAYVCQQGRCERPTTDAAVLEQQLLTVTGY